VSDTAIPTEQRLVLKLAAERLAEEFGGTFNSATIELFLNTSYDQFTGDAKVTTFLPLMAERFARQRLRALARVEGKATEGVPVVLFLCVHNAGRSQMALGWFNHLAGDRAFAWSGGVGAGQGGQPGRGGGHGRGRHRHLRGVPQAADGGDRPGRRCRRHHGCDDACPLLPGKLRGLVLSDPFGKSVEEVQPFRDEIGGRVRELLASLGVAANVAG